MGYLAKTDGIDARMLSHFARTLHSSERFDKLLFKMATPQQEQLQALVTRRAQLVHMRVAETNRLNQAHALSANALPAVYASGGSTSAITAEGGTDNSALGLFNGGIKVSGTVRPAFVHTSAAPNVIGTRTVLDHPLLNGAANAIVVASRAYTAALGFIAGGFSTFYDTATARWSILREDGSAMPTGVRFNVIVFSQ